MKKKVLLFGPIRDFGGRDVEVNIIAKSLTEEFDVAVFSTLYITKHSYAIAGLKDVTFSSFERRIYNSSWILRFLCSLFFIKNKKNKEPYAYVKNKISKLFFNFDKAKEQILTDEIQNTDVIIACVQLTSNYLKEVVEMSHQLKIPCFIRTTGTIREFDVKTFDFLKKVTCFIHHSESNAANLNKQVALPYVIIDQCAQFEHKLLALPIRENQNVCGFLGRLSSEKGIMELLHFYGNQKENKLIIAGNGPLKEEVLVAINNNKNIQYLGQCEPKNLDIFFSKIDILVIPSLEESGPLVGLEAMAASKIIISTKVGAMEERLLGTKNNFWFDLNDPTSFIDNLQKIEQLSFEDFNKIATVNREKYLKEYQMKTIKDKYIQCITRYLSK